MNHLYIIYGADHPFDAVYAVGPEGMEHIVVAASRMTPTDMRRHLLAAGIQIVESSVIAYDPKQPQWDGVYVRFPDEAGHECAGNSLRVTPAADGLPMLVDPASGELLAADDMPLRWLQPDPSEKPGRAGQILVEPPTFEQVPLGPIQIMEGQLSLEEEGVLSRALQDAGYTVQESEMVSSSH